MPKTLRELLARYFQVRASLPSPGDENFETRMAEGHNQMRGMEREIADQITALEEPGPAPVPLLERVQLRNYANAVLRGAAITGAEKELNDELNLSGDGVVPIDVIAMRADAPTTVAQGSVEGTNAPILQRIFPRTNAAFLGISMPMVPAGQRTYPVLTGGTTAAAKAANADTDAVAATFAFETVNPTRISARYLWPVEAELELGPELESTLRNDLELAMGRELDRQVIAGDGSAPNISGLIQELGAATKVGALGVANGWADYRGSVYDGLDASYDWNEGNIRVLMGINAYKAGRALYRTANTDGADAIMAMRETGAGVQWGPDMGTTNKTSSEGDLEQAIRAARADGAVAPVWRNVNLIRDPYTAAGKAQVSLTAHMFLGFALRRSIGYTLLQYRTSAKS